jgi:cytochrome c peroxidase
MPRFRTLLTSFAEPAQGFSVLYGCVTLLAVIPSAAAQLREPIDPIPLEMNEDPARVDLGRRLFEDVRLSRDKDRSCATCHPLDGYGMDGQPRARASGDVRIMRNTPSIFNVRFNLFYNWDGKFETLAALDDFVVQDRALMGNSWPELLATLQADRSYVEQFGHTYPEGISRPAVLDALEVFVRSLTTPNSRFDKYLRGDANALSASELRGYKLFKSYGCIACHQGMNVGGNLFQKFGVFPRDLSKPNVSESPDQGRYAVTKDLLDREVFRVPSLRNVAVTAPYFHSGRAATLEDAVDTMARVQLGRTLSREEISLIVQFLATLTGEVRNRPPTTQPTGSR